MMRARSSGTCSSNTRGCFGPNMNSITTVRPVQTTQLLEKNAASAIKVIATLHGDAPPYVLEFEQSVSDAQPPRNPVSHQNVEFPTGKVTRVRLFDLFEVQGFYGNPQQKRP